MHELLGTLLVLLRYGMELKHKQKLEGRKTARESVNIYAKGVLSDQPQLECSVDPST